MNQQSVFYKVARAAVACLLCLCIWIGVASAASEGGVLLSAEDLRTLEPAYDAFLQKLADVIVERGLLAPEDREDWLLYQMGDYYQNGGYGMIAAMFTPNLLDEARPQDAMLRLEKEMNIGTLHISTMRAYSPLDSAQPGLLLEASVTDNQGMPVACRLRWHCEQGGFAVWDALGGKVTEVGNFCVNDGRPTYWSDQPVSGAEPGALWRIGLDLLDPYDDAKVLGSAELVLKPEGSGWVLDENSLR